MKPLPIIFFCLFFIGVLSGCSNRGTYEAIQTGKKNECLTLPDPQQEECFEKANQSYNDYEQERQRLIKEE